MAQSSGALLQRPLYVFDLPEEILYTLELKAQLNELSRAPVEERELQGQAEQRREGEGADAAEGNTTAATSCALCNLGFPTVQEQRSHVRSDLHGYNLKQKMRGLPSVNDADFDRLVGDLDESISGSDTSDSGSSEDEKKDTTLSALLKKQANLAGHLPADDGLNPKKRKRGAGNAPLLWFSSPKLPSNISLGVYRTLFTPSEQAADPNTLIQTLQRKQLSSIPPPTQATSAATEDSGGVPLPRALQPNTSAIGPHYFLCMLGGGHFAGMLVSLTPKVTRKAGIEDRTATVLAQKTFHRYTTRRKQGGAQSANDSAKGAAHSAGSSLRRYNETALTSEVRLLLQEWRTWIETSELWFVRATGSTNRRTLFGPYENQVMHSNDDRIRGFPFSTKRATQSELMRAFVELTRVKVSEIDEEALARRAAEEKAALEQARLDSETAALNAKSVAEYRQRAKQQSRIDEGAALHTTQLQSLIRRSKAPALLAYLATSTLPPDFAFFPPDAPQNHHAPTPLHLASSLNSPACVNALLVKAGADPGTRSKEGKTAFEIAGDRATRDAFRLARTEVGEAKWGWDGAGVPAALSRQEAEKRAERERADKEVEERAEKARRAAETERLRVQERETEALGREKRFGKGKTMMMPSVEKTAQEKREDEARGMTPEMRIRLDRERRARAAEARLGAR